jgi:CPA2 family monovalent cation:H+ antiporter-2
VLIAAVVLGTALEAGRMSAALGSLVKVSTSVAGAIVVVIAAIVGLPLVIGLVRTARQLALELAQKSLPPPQKGKLDFAAAPRRALVVTLQLAIVAAVGVTVVALTQPFLPSFRLVLVPVAIVAVLVIAFWRDAMNLQGHATAGAEVIAMALGQQMAVTDDAEHLQRGMHRVREALPGLGEPVSLRIPPGSPADGRTLAELNLRGITGATVLAILRDGEQLPVPSGHDVVRAGDVLAIAGTQEATAAAVALLVPTMPIPPTMQTEPAPAAEPAAEPAAPAAPSTPTAPDDGPPPVPPATAGPDHEAAARV